MWNFKQFSIFKGSKFEKMPFIFCPKISKNAQNFKHVNFYQRDLIIFWDPKCCYIHQKHEISNKFFAKKSKKFRAFTVVCRFGDFQNFLPAVSDRFLENHKSWNFTFSTKSPINGFRKKHKKCKKFALVSDFWQNFSSGI